MCNKIHAMTRFRACASLFVMCSAEGLVVTMCNNTVSNYRIVTISNEEKV